MSKTKVETLQTFLELAKLEEGAIEELESSLRIKFETNKWFPSIEIFPAIAVGDQLFIYKKNKTLEFGTITEIDGKNFTVEQMTPGGEFKTYTYDAELGYFIKYVSNSTANEPVEEELDVVLE